MNGTNTTNAHPEENILKNSQLNSDDTTNGIYGIESETDSTPDKQSTQQECEHGTLTHILSMSMSSTKCDQEVVQVPELINSRTGVIQSGSEDTNLHEKASGSEVSFMGTDVCFVPLGCVDSKGNGKETVETASRECIESIVLEGIQDVKSVQTANDKGMESLRNYDKSVGHGNQIPIS